MGFAATLTLTYVTALTAAFAYGRYMFGLTIAAVLLWVALIVGMALAFRLKSLWAAPSALMALLPPASVAPLMIACATGSTGCM